MPLTPFHLGPALFFGLLLFEYVSLPAFLIANVVLDVEPMLVLFLGLDYPMHGFLHSFLGGSIVAVVLSPIMVALNGSFQKALSRFRLKQKLSHRSVWFSSFSGIYLHILLDSPLYSDIRPFFPLNINPFYGGSISAGLEVYGFCVFSFVAAVGLYVYKMLKR
ncbi:MAG: hypothetical protein ACUVQ8_06305 [Nitrososphaeria archaeon]